jgi:hypothetical protein
MLQTAKQFTNEDAGTTDWSMYVNVSIAPNRQNEVRTNLRTDTLQVHLHHARK